MAETETQTPDVEAPPQDDPAPGPVDVSRSAADVKASPEYRAQQKELRKAARQAGSAQAELARLREEVAAREAAAEAERQALQDAKIREVLGEEGVDLWSDLAELSASDPVQAAIKLRDLMLQKQEAAAEAEAAGGEAETTEQEEQVEQKPLSQVASPPAPPGGVAANAPLQARPNTFSYDEGIAKAQKVFDEIAERNQNPVTRNRVTMRDRAAGIMAYMEGAYLKHFRDRAQQ